LGEKMSRDYPDFMVSGGIQTWKPGNQMTLRDWVWDKLQVSVTIVNRGANEIRFTHKRSRNIEIPPGHQNTFKYFASEVLEIEGKEYIVPHQEKITVTYYEDGLAVGDLLTEDQVKEWDNLLDKRHQFTSFTEASNAYIPPKLPNFTPSGYKKIKMPDSIRLPLEEYYKSHKSSHRNEGFFPGYTIINSFSQDTGFVTLPMHRANQMIGAELRRLVGEWGNVPENNLELTSFYGIREYYQDHYLRCHVDRSQTHVLSVILHIASEDLTEEWPVEVVGFNGVRTTINMRHGEMLFYESAKLIHGRPKYLQGGKFINAFAHYRPSGDSKHLWGYRSRNDAIYDKQNKLVCDVKLHRLSEEMQYGRYADTYVVESKDGIQWGPNSMKTEL